MIAFGIYGEWQILILFRLLIEPSVLYCGSPLWRYNRFFSVVEFEKLSKTLNFSVKLGVTLC